MDERGVLDKYGIYTIPIILGVIVYLMFFSAPARVVDMSNYIDGGMTWGNPSASNVIVEFSDFECPYCARFHDDVFPQIKAKYIDTGKLYFVFKDFPLSFHKYSRPVAYLARCVYDVNKDAALDFITWIYSNQQTWVNNPGVVKDMVKSFADVDPDACLNDSNIQSIVSKNYNDGVTLGVTGTPTLYVNGKEFVGYVPFSKIEGVLNENN